MQDLSLCTGRAPRARPLPRLPAASPRATPAATPPSQDLGTGWPVFQPSFRLVSWASAWPELRQPLLPRAWVLLLLVPREQARPLAPPAAALPRRLRRVTKWPPRPLLSFPRPEQDSRPPGWRPPARAMDLFLQRRFSDSVVLLRRL